MSLGEKSCVYRSFKTSHCYSSNYGGSESCGHRSQDTSHPTSINHEGGGSRSILTSHSSSCNHGVSVDIGRSRSQENSHFSS